MFGRNLYLAPSQYEATFVNVSHSQSDIDAFCAAADDVLKTL